MLTYEYLTKCLSPPHNLMCRCVIANIRLEQTDYPNKTSRQGLSCKRSEIGALTLAAAATDGVVNDSGESDEVAESL